MISEKEVAKKKWTEQERLELAAKLDADLDAFIDDLEKKRYEGGWPEDRWEEEMEKHPFFMKKSPQPGDGVHPMFEGLQKLKYDPEENSAEDLALNYKEDGNFYVKHNKLRMAIYSYTEGLKAKCEKPEIQAVLYNNRSAAHFFLENYRSALADAQKALEYKSDYVKARWRAAQCAFMLERFDVCSQLCNEILENDVDHKEAQELLKKNKMKKIRKERNERKESAEKKKNIQHYRCLFKALEKRAVKFGDQKPGEDITEEILKPQVMPLEDHPVHFDEDNTTLIWPVVFTYPELQYCEFQQGISEEAKMYNVVKCLLANSTHEDKAEEYGPKKVNVYYTNRKTCSIHKIDMRKTIKEIVQEKEFFVTDGGVLLFYILRKDSKAERDFACARGEEYCFQ